VACLTEPTYRRTAVNFLCRCEAQGLVEVAVRNEVSLRKLLTSKRSLIERVRKAASLLGRYINVGKKEGVHNVHTWGFGFGCTGAGLGRIGEVFGGVADWQGPEPGSSPTSRTVFPRSGACGPLKMHKFCCAAPRGPFFYWWPLLRPAASLPTWSTVLTFVNSSWTPPASTT
jgi:hypothetical protein